MKGMIFTADSVISILNGTKTQSRRLVKMSERGAAAVRGIRPEVLAPGYLRWFVDGHGWNAWAPHKIGDLVYIKEAIKCISRHPSTGKAKAVYVADGALCPLDRWPWSSYTLSPIFMPYGLRRTTLQIAAIGGQLVQDISEEDARAEGVDEIKAKMPTARDAFRYAWDDINGCRRRREPTKLGERGYPRPRTVIDESAKWEQNPPVFIYTFLVKEKR